MCARRRSPANIPPTCAGRCRTPSTTISTSVTDFEQSALSGKFRSEIGNLAAAMGNTDLDHGTLISLGEEGTIHVPAGTIDVVPAWRWFLRD